MLQGWSPALQHSRPQQLQWSVLGDPCRKGESSGQCWKDGSCTSVGSVVHAQRIIAVVCIGRVVHGRWVVAVVSVGRVFHAKQL